MGSNNLTIFVSSTCYDLGQLRADLKEFIESYAFNAMLSEYNSFPVDPESGTVANCLRAVDDHADIFVLVIGGRYGSVADENKSVTNLEYLRARAKGMPIYAFVLTSIINILPVWKANPAANYTEVVDSPRLFEFVSALRDSGEVWVFPFDSAKQISDTLRTQWAYLFRESLHIRSRVKSKGLSATLQTLKGEALRLMIEQPEVWEALFLAQVLEDELARLKPLKQDLDYGVVLGAGDYQPPGMIMNWMQAKMNEMARILDASERLINVALKDALGRPGTDAKPEDLLYVARKMAHIYGNAIEWSLSVKRVHTHPEFDKLIGLTSNMSHDIISSLEEFSGRIRTLVKEAIAKAPCSGGTKTITLELKMTVPDTGGLHEELARMRELYESGYFE